MMDKSIQALSLLGKAALELSRAGYRVLPLKPGEKVPLGRLVPNGHHDASCDLAKIVRWWTEAPEANIGLALEPNLIVFDLDRHRADADGIEAFKRLKGSNSVSSVPAQKTAGNGAHIIFKNAPACVSGKLDLAPGIEVKTSGYIVVAPSRVAGRNLTPPRAGEPGVYEWADSRDIVTLLPPPMPNWLSEAIDVHVATKRTLAKNAENNNRVLNINDSELNQRNFVSYLERELPAAEGQHGNDRTYMAACVGRDFGLSEQVAFNLLLQSYNPRCQPPWSERDLAQLVSNAYKYAKGSQGARSKQPKQADRLLHCAASANLWHSKDGTAYATFEVTGHQENHRVRSNGFRNWLSREYYRQSAGAPSKQAVDEALGVIEAKARFDGPEFQPVLRVAQHDGNIYLDFCNAEWQAVEVTPDGWRILTSSEVPVKFTRSRNMLPLPAPVPADADDLLRLRDLLNLPGGSSWTMLLAFVVACFNPRSPYPILVLTAEQGAGKSTLTRAIRELIDPNVAPLRATPREERDLLIAASNGHVLAFDNLSGLKPELSDALCRMSTGGGNGFRELYSNAEEMVFDVRKPVVINGIDDLATRGDLLDRSIVLHLPPIPENRRRTEAEFWSRFESIRPVVLGALLNAVSGALKRLPATKLASLPRMADFALWVTAAEADLGLASGAIMTAYEGNRHTAAAFTVSSSPIAQALSEIAPWSGTPTALWSEVRAKAPGDQRLLPRTAQSLSNQLRRLAPVLRMNGIEISWRRTGNERLIQIQRSKEEV